MRSLQEVFLKILRRNDCLYNNANMIMTFMGVEVTFSLLFERRHPSYLDFQFGMAHGKQVTVVEVLESFTWSI